jgi:hypothetical protein
MMTEGDKKCLPIHLPSTHHLSRIGTIAYVDHPNQASTIKILEICARALDSFTPTYLDLQHTRHDWSLREMAVEELVVHSHVLKSDSCLARLILDDLVN